LAEFRIGLSSALRQTEQSFMYLRRDGNVTQLSKGVSTRYATGASKQECYRILT
jgi:hypothetical protein